MDENKEIAENKELEEAEEEKSGDTGASEEKSGNTEDNEKKKEKLIRDIVDIAESTLITVFIIVMVFTYILHPVNIVGRSMVPTLNKNIDSSAPGVNAPTDKVFMTTIYFGIDHGDILVINKDKNYLLDENGDPYVPEGIPSLNECIIKRVIAVGGQTVDIKNGQVVVDGKVLDEPYVAPGSTTEGLGGFDAQYPITIPEGYYFVMGDNRNHSTDSRAASVGLVKKDQIYGKAIIKYAPLSEFDILTDSDKG